MSDNMYANIDIRGTGQENFHIPHTPQATQTYKTPQTPLYHSTNIKTQENPIIPNNIPVTPKNNKPSWIPLRPDMMTVRKAMVIDTETTGLPPKDPANSGKFYPSRLFNHYDCARVVQVAWILMDPQNGRVHDTRMYMVKPDGYIVPEESTRIHGISHLVAESQGVHFQTIADELSRALEQCECVVAHNARFDMSVLLAEGYRYKHRSLVSHLYDTPRFDTMWEGRSELGLKKIPKLIDLYNALHGSKTTQLHDALDDARLASKCLSTILKRRRAKSYCANLNLRPRAMIKKPTWLKNFCVK